MFYTKPFVVPLQKCSFFSKSNILDRSYGSFKQNLHSVVHKHYVIPFLYMFIYLYTSLCTEHYKIMRCVEGDKSDCQPKASSIAQSRRLRAMVVVEV